MDTTSTPITPLRQYMSPLETSPRSPTNSYREQFRRRTSSLSSNHDRSPTSIRTKNRFSNASWVSSGFSPDGEDGGGMGNLADELDQLDDEGEELDVTDETVDEQGDGLPSPVDGARDSGIDVSYSSSKRSSPHVRNFSKPFGTPKKVEEPEAQEERLSSELEDLISSVARMASYADASEDPIIPRVVRLLQDLGNQTNLEASVQRLNTSTNSMTAHLMTQSKSLQALMASVYSPLAMFSAPLDADILEEIGPLIEELIKDLPLPDTTPLQGLQKLVRETDNVSQTLAQLTDTLQMSRHSTNTAARHLRTTQTMVAELRRERERAEIAREELQRGSWDDRIRNRRCASECRDIMSGFEQMCDSLRENLVQAGNA